MRPFHRTAASQRGSLIVPARLGLAAAVLAAGLLGTSGALAEDAPAPAAPKDTVRVEMGPPLQAAQQFLKDRKYAEALAKIKEAEALPNHTPYENFILDRMRASAAAGAGDDALAVSSSEAVIASGRLPAADAQRMEYAIASTYYKQKNYAKSASWTSRYLKEGGADPGARELLLASYFQGGDYANVVSEVKGEIDAGDKSGHKSSETHLRMLLESAQKLNDGATESFALEQLLLGYGKKELWDFAISRLVHKAGFAERLELDLLRLELSLGGLKHESDYMSMAQLALQAGFPGEAKKIVAQGFASGALGKGAEADRHKRLEALVNKEAAEDAKNPGQGDAEAERKGGDALFNAGYNHVINGQAESGLGMIDQALAKGGFKRPEDAKLHAGIAYYVANQKAKAIEIFHKVQGNDGTADLAHLWAIHAAK